MKLRLELIGWRKPKNVIHVTWKESSWAERSLRRLVKTETLVFGEFLRPLSITTDIRPVPFYINHFTHTKYILVPLLVDVELKTLQEPSIVSKRPVWLKHFPSKHETHYFRAHSYCNGCCGRVKTVWLSIIYMWRRGWFQRSNEIKSGVFGRWVFTNILLLWIY